MYFHVLEGEFSLKNYDLDRKCGSRLAECMKSAKMTGTDLAKKVNEYYVQNSLSATNTMSQQKISTIVNGRVHLKQEDAVLFANILNVDVNYLLGKTDYKTSIEKNKNRIAVKSEKETLYYKLLELHGYKLISTVSQLSEITHDSYFINQWIINDKAGKSTSLHHVTEGRPRIIFLYNTNTKELSPPILIAEFKQNLDNIDYFFNCLLERPFKKQQTFLENLIPIKGQTLPTIFNT